MKYIALALLAGDYLTDYLVNVKYICITGVL